MIDAPRLIRTHRQAAGLSQRALARRAGTSSATLHRYEAGQVDPGTATVNRLLRACLPRRRRWATVGELARALDDELSHAGEHAWRLVGEFLDDDRGADDRELGLSVIDPPSRTASIRAQALAAALAEHLCLRRGLVPPSWTQVVVEVVPWWFVAGDGFNALALRESPVSFARRGIFVTRGALERV